MSHRTQAELPLFIPTVMTPQGDGSYVCRPGRPVRDLTPARRTIERSLKFRMIPQEPLDADMVADAIADKDAVIAELRARLEALEAPKPARKKPGPKPKATEPEPESVPA